jgi:hypothetical protein
VRPVTEVVVPPIALVPEHPPHEGVTSTAYERMGNPPVSTGAIQARSTLPFPFPVTVRRDGAVGADDGVAFAVALAKLDPLSFTA